METFKQKCSINVINLLNLLIQHNVVHYIVCKDHVSTTFHGFLYLY